MTILVMRRLFDVLVTILFGLTHLYGRGLWQFLLDADNGTIDACSIRPDVHRSVWHCVMPLGDNHEGIDWTLLRDNVGDVKPIRLP